MNDKSNEPVAFDRQIGEANIRMNEHDRRLEKLDETSEKLRQELIHVQKNSASFDQRLKNLEENTADIKKSIKALESKMNAITGFVNGFKAASAFWYAAITMLSAAAGYFISKLIQ